jgi:cystine transport system substrate-binding protein
MIIPARRSVLALGLAGLVAACVKTPSSAYERVKKTGVLKVGLEGTYPPFSSQDERGDLVGFDVDVAKALAEKLGAKAQFQPAQFAGLLGALESGRSDVVINQITITPARHAKYGFSEPYTVSGAQIIVKRDRQGIAQPADLLGKKVGVGLGTNYEAWLRANVPGAIVKTYDDDPTKYQDLKAGRIDAVLNDRLVAADFIKRSGEPIVPVGQPFAPQKQGIAFKPDPAFKAAIDKALADMRASGELAAISQKWFGLDATR